MEWNKISSVDFTKFLPTVLCGDVDILAFAAVAAEELQMVAQQIHQNVIYTRLSELDEAVLDILAYDFHVDWYDLGYGHEVKQAVLTSSIGVHRCLGTKYAIETALGNVYPGSRVKEWFEYGGKPFTFRIDVDVTNKGISETEQRAVLEQIHHYKNLRSHYEKICYNRALDGVLPIVSYHSIGQQLDIYPFLVDEIISDEVCIWTGYQQITQSIQVYPIGNEV